MNKKLKNFIEENRRAFDDELPSSATWDRIETSVKNGKGGKLLTAGSLYKWSAAAAVFFIAAAVFYFLVIKKGNDKEQLVKKEDRPALHIPETEAMTPEYAAKARKIVEAIESSQQQLKDITADRPALYDQFAQDLATLDSSYRVLKNQAMQTPNREVIIQAMMQNLQLQASLLGKQLQIIFDLKNNKTSNNEKDAYRPL